MHAESASRSRKRRHNNDEERFYLFPGQGGASLRRRQMHMLAWSVAVAVLASAVIGGVIYLLDKP
ncbi:MAG: hypothetical protein KGR98_13470 [Verrucomicrobia bacterium]|nr:hypothetical protein [Verrucomicrobiota bacterium]MDE3097997.1 hypothetical protein [Verrucomicrobiota bacterium]